MNEDRNYKIATVVLSGYGDNDNSVSALMIDLTFIHQHYIKDGSEGVFRFPFNYSASNRRQETFVSFNELRNRFTKFLRNNGLLESDVVIDIVGFSQGGMIALYSAGLNKNIREHIRKYVSIASPHGGAQNLNLLTLLDLLPFVIFPMISWIPGLIARRVLSKGGTAQLVGNQPSFLQDSYPEAAKKVFAEIPSKNMLQIWSPHDNVAYESSCKRFVTGDFKYDGPDRDFKDKMIPYETDIRLHTAIPQKREVREKVIDFLYKDIIEIEKLSRLLPHIETEKHSGVPGEKIQIESPYFGFYEVNYSYSVTIDNEPVESILENGKLYFKIPDISQGEKVVQVIFGNIPDLQQVESDTLPFIIQPHITLTYQKGIIIRKLIHLSIGLIIWILSYVVEKNVLLYLIVAGTVFSFLTFNYKKFYLLHKTTDASLGTLFYPVGILSSYLILYNLPLYYFQSSLLVLSISDTLANFAGQIHKGNGWIRTFHDKKSIYGITAYSFSACLLLYLFLPDSLSLNIPYILFALVWAVILETASMRGSDNFSIPAGLALFFLLTYHYEVDYLYLSALLLILAPGCFLLFKFNILTRRGSFVAYLLGFYFAGIKGWPWLMPVLLFFLSSAAFTKLQHAIKGDGNKTTARNAWQVIANTVWAVTSSALFLFTRNEIFILFFIAFVAAVTADTWASEIGPLLNKRCFSLSKMRTVQAGTNGGISFFGSLTALTGATIISSLSYYVFFGFWHWDTIAILSVSAFIACFADSLLGAFVEDRMLQMNYFKKQKTLESITPNDLVNMIGSVTAFVFYILLSWIFL